MVHAPKVALEMLSMCVSRNYAKAQVAVPPNGTGSADEIDQILVVESPGVRVTTCPANLALFSAVYKINHSMCCVGLPASFDLVFGHAALAAAGAAAAAHLAQATRLVAGGDDMGATPTYSAAASFSYVFFSHAGTSPFFSSHLPPAKFTSVPDEKPPAIAFSLDGRGTGCAPMRVF